MSWTPGPWRACRSHEDFDGPMFDIDPEERAEYDARPFVRIIAENGKYVTAAHDCFEFSEANARLIAAAPELAEMLARVLDFYAPDCEHDCRVEEHGPAGEARKLLERIS